MKNKRTVNYNITQEQFCYMAGFIDSGSSFTLQQQRAGRKDKETGIRDLRWVSGFSIQHTNYKIIEHFTQLIFLGDSYKHIINMVRTGHSHRLMKAIRVTGQVLDYILPQLIPHLIIKKEHAQVVHDFRKTMGDYGTHNPLPTHIQEYRMELRDKMRYLNSSQYKETNSGPLLPAIIKKECC
jgi:hypothetical protein